MGTIVNLSNISLSLGTRTLFEGISCSFEHGQRTGLVGRNGSGKSTFLKLVAGLQQPDTGSIAITKDARIAYLPQEIILSSTKPVIEETVDAHAECYSVRMAIAALEERVHQGEASEDEISTYSHLVERLAALQPEAIRHRAERILRGLGFHDAMLSSSVATLSTGWKMRVVLAQLLLQDADLYLFDEPTNHLDIVAKEWFFEFLSETKAGYVLVCHDRYFLDHLCTSILSLDQKPTKLFRGSFKAFEIYQEELFARQQQAYDLQQKEIQQKMDTIQRFRAKANKAKMAQSMIKELDRMERLEPPATPPKTIRLRFPAPQRPGRIVLTVKNVAHHFGAKELFHHVSFQVERGQKIALIAPNGTGKTTLFNILIGKQKLQKGTVEFGHNVEPALFVQEQETFLDGKRTAFQNVSDNCPRKTDHEIRSMLGAFLFSGDDVEKPVRVLSGGEKNRVGMAITLLQDANFLLLDEPTNHLDIPSKEILLQALIDCPATMLFVSHDHDFINRLATHIIDLTPNGAYLYHGNYDSYLAYKRGQPVYAPETVTAKQPEQTPTHEPKESSSNSYEERKELQKLERLIGSLEQKKRNLELSFAELEYGTPLYAKEHEKLLALEKQLAECMKRWEELAE